MGKNKGDISIEKLERDEDFYRAYEEVLQKYGATAAKMSKSALIDEAINKQPQKFHINKVTAWQIIYRKLREKSRGNNKN